MGPVALAELADLGLDLRREYAATNIVRRAAVAVDGEVLITSPLPGSGSFRPSGGSCRGSSSTRGSSTPRVTPERASCEGRRATEIELDGDGVTLTVVEGRSARRIRARVVIGADGSNSRTAEWLRGRPVDKQSRMIAVRAYYDGVEGPEDRADLYFSERSFPATSGSSPRARGRANVGIGTVLRTAPPATDHLRDLLLGLVRDDRAVAAGWARRGSRARWSGGR